MGAVSMRLDPRCKKVNRLSDRYHQLFSRLGEKYIRELSRQYGLSETLTYGDFAFLSVLGESDRDAVTMAEVSKKLGINPSTATRRVNKLVGSGMVTKSAAADDDRRYDIRLTDAGRTLLEAMNGRLSAAIEKTYENVTDEEMHTVYRYLEKCISQLRVLLDAGDD